MKDRRPMAGAAVMAAAIALGAWGCDDGPSAGWEAIPNPTPIHEMVVSDSVQLGVHAEIGPGGRGDLRVALLMYNPTSSNTTASFGACFFIARIFPGEQPSGSAIWDHRPPQGGGCHDGDVSRSIPAGTTDTLRLIPEIVPDYNRALPSGTREVWLLVNLSGRVEPVGGAQIEVP